MDVCHAPMDIICSSAVSEILSYNPGKPVLLAETGAVEARHAGPSRYYKADTAGILLHDILFAPFFSGSAGSGMCWHWESYVDRNNLWYHFGRFSETIKGINPIEEGFVPAKTESGNLRIYQLTGKKTVLLWIRDMRNTWQSELSEGQPPQVISGVSIDLKSLGISEAAGEVSVYDPWKNAWEKKTPDNLKIILPDFKRSIVVRLLK